LDQTEPYDAKGCWFGLVTILADGRPAILYTGTDGVKNQAQCITFPATSLTHTSVNGQSLTATR
jgi:beta-fructofuranosidase